VEYQPVTSTSVAAIGYDPDTNTLGVRFLNGGEFHYYGVSADVFEGMKAATSVGRYLDQYIKKAGYQYARVG
jgi:hypothetical protein